MRTCADTITTSQMIDRIIRLHRLQIPLPCTFVLFCWGWQERRLLVAKALFLLNKGCQVVIVEG